MENTAFDFKRIAQGYKNRPYLHKQVIEQLEQELSGKRFKLGLDIGCGAGLSTKALCKICARVIGSDISSEMIEVAKEVCENDASIEFVVSKAEEITIAEKKADIVTAAGAIQWIDRELFLKKMQSVMEIDGYLFIYDFAISDTMKDSVTYTDWWHDVYLKEFPRPYRNETVWTQADVEPYGFVMEKQEDFVLTHEFDKQSFIEFMMIQSNVNAKIEGEERSTEAVKGWFEESLKDVFLHEKETLLFKGYGWRMRKME